MVFQIILFVWIWNARHGVTYSDPRLLAIIPIFGKRGFRKLVDNVQIIPYTHDKYSLPSLRNTKVGGIKYFIHNLITNL